jgi:hypothetical protein
MTNTSLLQLVRKMDAKTLARFELWLGSDFVNAKATEKRLLAHLRKGQCGSDPTFFAEKQLCAAIGDKNAADLAQLRYVMSDLLAKTRLFLAQEVLAKRPILQAFLLDDAIKSWGVSKEMVKNQRFITQTLEAQPLRSSAFFLQKYQAEQAILDGMENQSRSGALDLEPSLKHLITYFLTEIFRNTSIMLTQQAILDKKYAAAPFENAVDFVQKQPEWLEIPAISVHFYVCQALLFPTEYTFFEKWKDVVLAFHTNFSTTELRGIYLMGINFCIKQMNVGSDFHKKEAFVLYQKALELGLLHENGWISVFTFKNIIRLGTGLSETEWTDRFFETHRASLSPDLRHEHVKFNQAFLFFQKNDFEKTILTLRDLAIFDPFVLLDSRRMLLRSYFELREWQALESFLNSFSILLKRRKNLGYHQPMNLNLIKYTRILMRKQLGFSSKSKIELQNVVKNETLLAERIWLLEKIETVF